MVEESEELESQIAEKLAGSKKKNLVENKNEFVARKEKKEKGEHLLYNRPKTAKKESVAAVPNQEDNRGKQGEVFASSPPVVTDNRSIPDKIVDGVSYLGRKGLWTYAEMLGSPLAFLHDPLAAVLAIPFLSNPGLRILYPLTVYGIGNGIKLFEAFKGEEILGRKLDGPERFIKLGTGLVPGLPATPFIEGYRYFTGKYNQQPTPQPSA